MKHLVKQPSVKISCIMNMGKAQFTSLPIMVELGDVDLDLLRRLRDDIFSMVNPDYMVHIQLESYHENKKTEE